MSLRRIISQPSCFLHTHPLSQCALLLSLPMVYILSTGNLSSSFLPSKMGRRARESLDFLFIRLRAKGSALWGQLWVPWLQSNTSPYRKFETPEQEDEYWRNSEIAQRELSSSDARYANPDSTPAWNARNEKPILYYTPRLLPEYRDIHLESSDAVWPTKANIPVKAFMKWHWLVFPDRPHPTYMQASFLLQHFSNADLREIHRISRLVPATEIGQSGHTSHITSHRARRARTNAGLNPTLKPELTYLHLWRNWLQKKSSDLVICFEKDR